MHSMVSKIKKNQQANQNTDYDEVNLPPVDEDMPSDFRSVNARRNAAWFKPEPGLILQGVLLGRYSRVRETEKRSYYQIQLTKSTQAYTLNDDEKTWDLNYVKKGCIVNIDERSDLQGLVELVDNGKINEVWIKAVSKMRIPNSNKSFWQFKVGMRELSKMPEDFLGVDEHTHTKFDEVTF